MVSRPVFFVLYIRLFRHRCLSILFKWVTIRFVIMSTTTQADQPWWRGQGEMGGGPFTIHHSPVIFSSRQIQNLIWMKSLKSSPYSCHMGNSQKNEYFHNLQILSRFNKFQFFLASFIKHYLLHAFKHEYTYVWVDLSSICQLKWSKFPPSQL